MNDFSPHNPKAYDEPPETGGHWLDTYGETSEHIHDGSTDITAPDDWTSEDADHTTTPDYSDTWQYIQETPKPERLVAPADIAAIEREVLIRGDHQLPDEPNRGFTIERKQGAEHEPVPIDEVLRTDVDFRAEDFAKKYVDGEILTTMVEDAWEDYIVRGMRGFIVTFPVPKATYEAAVAAERIAPVAHDETGRVAPLTPGYEQLDDLLDEDAKREAVATWYKKQARDLKFEHIDDLDDVPDRETLTEVSEAYELQSGGRSVRLINFSRTSLSDSQLSQAVNAVRSTADRSGGEVLDRLDTIAILPAHHASLEKVITREDGTEVRLAKNAYQTPHVLVVSEKMLWPPEQRPPRSAESKALFEKHRLPDEPTEGDGAPAYTVSEGRWEVTLAHELGHIGLPESQQQYAALPKPAPTLYGRTNNQEHLAELEAAAYIGGAAALAVPESQREALAKVRAEQRGSQDDHQPFKRPLGPQFITCMQLDITNGPLPLRLKKTDKPLALEVVYRLT